MIAACMNIFVNYNQNMTIINILNLNWKEIASSMFQVHKAVSATVHQAISLDCLIKGSSYKIFKNKTKKFYVDHTESFYLQITSTILYPLAFSGLLFLYWFSYKFMNKISFSLMLEKYLLTFYILMTFFLSPVINSISIFFDCTTLYSNNYITQNLMEKCNDNPRYSSWRSYVMLPAFFFYGVFFPLLIFFYLFKNRKNMFEEKLMAKIGFLLKGYTENRFYW